MTDAPLLPPPPSDAEAAGAALARGPRKSATAFRTISEVADELHVPQHVLRFWEGKFPQLRPLKRGGGRRYYRPEDIALLRRIGDLLYTQGYTIKGVQRVLRDGAGAAVGGPRAGSPLASGTPRPTSAGATAGGEGRAGSDATGERGGGADPRPEREDLLRDCLAELEDIAARLRALPAARRDEG